MRDGLLRLGALIRKELLAILKDPASRAILVLPVLVQSVLFGYGATYDLKRVPYAVLDESRSVSSAALLARLDAAGVFQRVATLDAPAQMHAWIDNERALMVVRIGARFETALLSGETAPVHVLLDARNSTTANAAAADVGAVIERFNDELRARRGLPGPVLALVTRAWFNPDLETRWNFMPGLIASLSMLQTLLLAALSVAREREQGTFDQLLVTPLSPLEIMVGKAIPPVLIGLLQSTLILLITRWWFQVPMAGSPITLYTGLLAFVVASVGIGLAVSALAATMQQAMLYTFVLLMPMLLLSGLTTPISTMPRALQIATLANPLRFGIDLVRRVYLEGVDLATVMPDLIPLAIIAALTLPSAAWLFRHRLA